jgi:hypothetical protein
MLLQINRPEHELLQAVLAAALANLREEIYKTEAAEYQWMLKQRESLLTGLVARLSAASGLAVGEPVSEQLAAP